MNIDSYFENIKTYKLLANKSLGQNFLINPGIAEEIVKKLDLNEADNVLEIGAGLGSLSIFLASSNANVTLIDIDERMLSFLTKTFSENKNVVVKSIISAKNVNAKKSAKTVKIKVTLKKVNGKYLKNKKVTLKFNKKTFKAKTNKKGVVTFTIKKNVYNKLKAKKKYTYQVIYAKDKVKKTIKFKK